MKAGQIGADGAADQGILLGGHGHAVSLEDLLQQFFKGERIRAEFQDFVQNCVDGIGIDLGQRTDIIGNGSMGWNKTFSF